MVRIHGLDKSENFRDQGHVYFNAFAYLRTTKKN